VAQRISRKELKQQDEFQEVGFDLLEWVEKRRSTVIAVGGGFLGLVALVGLWTGISRMREGGAEKTLTEGLALYAKAGQAGAPADALEQARKKFAEAKGGTSAGEVAAFYEGAAMLRQGKAKEAAPLLEKAADGAETRTVMDSARAMAAEAYEEAGDLEKAASVWRALADDPGAVYPPDMALLRLGDVKSRQGKTEEATAAWREALARSPQGPAATEAQQRLGTGPAAPATPLTLPAGS
jgi:tetratricopeptide (TPR) repeat protein